MQRRITCSKQDDARKKARWAKIASYAQEFGRKAATIKFKLGRERIRQIIVLDERYNRRG